MRFLRATVPMIALGVVLAACSGAYGGGAAAPTTAPATAAPSAAASGGNIGGGGSSPAAAAASVDLASTKLGTVLVDGSGRTLYVFTADSNGTSACTGSCLENWPPLASDAAPMVGAGLAAADFSTITRPDGSHQVAFHGMPLYYFAGDTSAGDTNGQGIGGKWYVVGADGSMIGASSAASPAPSSSSKGYSY